MISDGKKCLFCPETEALEEHHVIPQSIMPSSEAITLCSNCHTKIHNVIRPLIQLINGKAPEAIDRLLELPDCFKEEYVKYKEKRSIFEKIFIQLASNDPRGFVRNKDLIEKLTTNSMNREEAQMFLLELNRSGIIYIPRDGFWKHV